MGKYGEDVAIQRLLNEVITSKSIVEVSKQFILEHDKENKVNGMSKGNRITRIYVGLRLGLFIKKGFDRLCAQDVRDFLAQHVPRSKSNYRDRLKHEYSARTMLLHKIHLKAFLKWVYGMKKKDAYPECVEWIYTSRPKDVPFVSLRPQEVLTKADVLALVSATTCSRDAALIHTLFETGCRDGEWRTINYSDLQIDERIAKAHVRGKTGERIVYMVKSFPRLRDWLNVHPLRHKKDFPLWVSLHSDGGIESIGSCSWRKRLLRIREHTKIDKPVNPHAFRHASATEDAKNGWNEAMMRKKYGWSETSHMPSVYIHLANTDIEDKILKEAGVKPKQTIEDKIMDFVVCPRCNKEWSPGTKFCICGNILDTATAIEYEETKTQDDKTVLTVMENITTMKQKMTEVFAELDKINKQKQLILQTQEKRKTRTP